jgi:methionine-gamma-lyase
MNKETGFSTRAIHAGEKKTEIGLNPTTEVLEEKIADLEGGEAALAQASGMAAISAAVLASVKAGDHVIADEVIYGSTYDLFVDLAKFGVKVSFVDTSDLNSLENAFMADTKLVFFETPANPTMKLTDIKAVSDIAHEKGSQVAVDNTFMTPYFQRPLSLGADVVGTVSFISSTRHTAKNIGGALSPFNAWLIIRGMKTLAVRMDRHNSNAMDVARFLEGHEKIERVLYPGLSSFPQKDIAGKQMKGNGGMIAFVLKNARDVPLFLNALKLCTLAVSLGETATLVQHPASMTHAVIPRENRLKYGIPDELVRMSVGLEDVEDIIADVKQALEYI